jgi:hypothetical protein
VKLDSLLPGSKDLGTRFALVGQLPTIVLVLFVLGLLWSGAPAHAPELDRVVDKINGLGSADAVLLVVGVVAAGLLLQPFQFALIRLLEGYWGGTRAAELLAAPALSRQKTRRRSLDDQTVLRQPMATDQQRARMAAATTALRLRYPKEARLLPTALGNILRAAEDRAGSRYGLDTVVVWPRLYPVLPETMRGILDAQRTQLDLAARFTVVSVLAAAASTGFLAGHGWWLFVAAGALGFGWFSYRSAMAAALAYGQLLDVSFDLYRFDLLRALRLPLPETSAAEREQNVRLSNRLRQDVDLDNDGRPREVVYLHDDAKDDGLQDEAVGSPASAAR